MPHLLQAGYIIESFIESSKKDNRVFTLAQNLCRFSTESDLNTDPPVNVEATQSPLAVLHNIIIRGAPTRGSVFMDEAFVRKYQLLEKRVNETTGSLHFLRRLCKT